MSTKRFAVMIAGALAGAAAITITTAPANAESTWDVISYSPDTGAWGWGYAPSKEQASQIAIDYCIQHGGTNCQLAAWSPQGCVAVARDADSWHGGHGATLAQAEGNALFQNGGGTIVVSKC